MRIVQEEIFGPVVVVARFKDEADVIEMAHDTVYGLAAAVFSRDISRALTVAHKLRAGTVWVNVSSLLAFFVASLKLMFITLVLQPIALPNAFRGIQAIWHWT